MDPSRRRLRLRPTQVIVLSFLLLATAGWLLLLLPASSAGQPLAAEDALFMSVSAVCVTGLSVLEPGRDLTGFGQVVLLALIQFGGLGYMVISTAFMVAMGHRIHLRHRMLLREAMGSRALGRVPELWTTAIVGTLLCEAVGAVVLTLLFLQRGLPAPTALWQGVFHSVSAFCNAGLDILGAPAVAERLGGPVGSFLPFVRDPAIYAVILLQIVLGGLGFVVLLELAVWRPGQRLSLHAKIALGATGVLILGGAAVFLLLESGNPATFGPLSWPAKAGAALFQSITARTAGFSTVAQGSLYPASQLFCCWLMFVGACPGGTGGGVKTTTFVVILLAAASAVRGQDDVMIFRRRISHEAVYRALAVVVLSALVVVLQSFLFGVFELSAVGRALADQQTARQTVPHQFMEYLFEATSAFGTVGLSTGVTGSLSLGSKLTAVVTMLLGRIGPVTLVMALAERPRRYQLQRPTEHVMIG